MKFCLEGYQFGCAHADSGGARGALPRRPQHTCAAFLLRPFYPGAVSSLSLLRPCAFETLYPLIL